MMHFLALCFNQTSQCMSRTKASWSGLPPECLASVESGNVNVWNKNDFFTCRAVEFTTDLCSFCCHRAPPSPHIALLLSGGHFPLTKYCMSYVHRNTEKHFFFVVDVLSIWQTIQFIILSYYEHSVTKGRIICILQIAGILRTHLLQ